MQRNNLAKNEDTSAVLVSQISSAEGEPLTHSVRQEESNLSDLAQIIFSFTSASFL